MPRPQTASLDAWKNSGLRSYLHQLRLHAGLSHANVAKEAGYQSGEIASWERAYACPNFAQISDWANALGFRLSIRVNEPAKSTKQWAA